MASPNLNLVRSIYATWELGDYSSTEWADPQIEFVAGDGPALGTWTGTTGLAEGARGFLSAWEDYRIEADEYRELDGGRILVLQDVSGRGKASGVEMRSKTANLFHLRGGKVTRLVAYFDPERALADLGLAAETGTPRP